MRRAWVVLLALGIASILVAIPLWHITRQDTSGCQSGVPCDPRLLLPYGGPATVLTLFGVGTLFVALVALTVILVRHLLHPTRPS